MNSSQDSTVKDSDREAATALTTRNIELYTKGQTPITSNARQIPENCVKIIVDSDEQGNPTVAFYDEDNKKIDIN